MPEAEDPNEAVRWTTTPDARRRRNDAETVPITDQHHGLLDSLFVGRRIVAFEREPSTDEEFPEDANAVSIALDNGAVLHFSGWGYDANGLHTDYTPPDEASTPPPAPER